MWVLLGLGCSTSPSTEPPASVGPSDSDSETDPQVIDTETSQPLDGDVVDVTELEEAPSYSSDDLFDDTVLHQIEVDLSDDAWQALLDDPYTYVSGSVTVDGVFVEEVGVRLRGKLGSFQPITGKPKWKFDINRFVSGQRVFDVKAISLNNSVVDCSYLREIISYDVYRAVGVFSPRMSFTQVTVNGMDYGLYQIIETQDDAYLDERYDDASGNLYDGKYYWGGGWDFATIDFTPDLYQNFVLEEGTDVGLVDVQAVTAALVTESGTPDFYANLEPLIDWEQFHRYFVAEHWVDNGDGYTLGQNNYRVYFRVSDGRVVFHPFDFDYSLQSSSWGSWGSPSGEVVSRCWDDEVCLSAHKEWVTAMTAEIGKVDWQAKIDAWDALTYDAAVSDPKRACNASGITPDRDFLREWMTDRPDEMADFWDL
jgi:spore coat protein CotH